MGSEMCIRDRVRWAWQAARAGSSSRRAGIATKNMASAFLVFQTENSILKCMPLNSRKGKATFRGDLQGNGERSTGKNPVVSAGKGVSRKLWGLASESYAFHDEHGQKIDRRNRGLWRDGSRLEWAGSGSEMNAGVVLGSMVCVLGARWKGPLFLRTQALGSEEHGPWFLEPKRLCLRTKRAPWF